MVNHFIKLPKDVEQEIISCFKLIEFEKNTNIILPGDTSKNVFFVLNGVVRIYYVKEEKDITVTFKTEHSFFTNSNYLYGNFGNFYTYTTLEKTVCLYIEYDELEKLYSKHHILERLGRKIVEYNYVNSIQSLENIIFLSADERFLNFNKNFAALFNRIQLKYIASYLGVTQETLSRLRSKFAQQNAEIL